MKTILSLLFMILFAFPALAADPWSKQDVALEAAWQLIHVADWGQTAMIARNPERYHEINPLLGEHPTPQKVHIYMATGALVHLGVTHFIPAGWRPYWQAITIGMSGACVINNFDIGLQVRF